MRVPESEKIPSNPTSIAMNTTKYSHEIIRKARHCDKVRRWGGIHAFTHLLLHIKGEKKWDKKCRLCVSRKVAWCDGEADINSTTNKQTQVTKHTRREREDSKMRRK